MADVEGATLQERKSGVILSSFENEITELSNLIDQLDKAVHRIVAYVPTPETARGEEIAKKQGDDSFNGQIRDRIAAFKMLNRKLSKVISDLETF